MLQDKIRKRISREVVNPYTEPSSEDTALKQIFQFSGLMPDWEHWGESPQLLAPIPVMKLPRPDVFDRVRCSLPPNVQASVSSRSLVLWAEQGVG